MAFMGDQGRGRNFRLRGGSRLLLALALAVVSVCGVIFGVKLQSDNDGLVRQSVAARLAAQAIGLAPSDPRLAAQLATASYRLTPDPATRAALFEVAEADPAVSRILNAGSAVNALAEDQNGQYLYSASLDGTLDSWDMMTGSRLAQIRLSSPIQALAVDPDGPLLVGVDWTGDILIWHTGPRGLVKQAEVPSYNYSPASTIQLIGIGFFDSGQRVFAVYSNGGAAVYSATSGTQLAWPAVTSGTLSLAVASGVDSPDVPPGQATVYVGTSSQSILALNLKTLRYSTVLSTYKLPSNPTSIAVQPGSPKTIAVSGSSGTILWDLTSGKPTWNYPVSTLAAEFDSDDSALAVQTADGVAALPLPGTVTGSQGPTLQVGQAYAGPSAVLTTPTGTGTLIAVGSDDGSIAIMDPAKPRFRLPAAPASTVLTFDQAGRLILSANDSSDNRTSSLYLTDPQRGFQSGSYRQLISYQFPASWGPDGEYYVNSATTGDGLVFAAGQDTSGHGAVFMWNEKSGHAVRKLLLPGSPRLGVEVRYDRQLKLLIVLDSNGQVDAWSTAGWGRVMLMSLGSTSGSFDLSPDGGTLVAAVEYGAANTVPTRHTGKLAIINLRMHKLRQIPVTPPALKVAYAPDGDSLAVAGLTNALRFMTPTGQQIASRPEITLPGIPADLAYNSNGSLLAVALADGRILIYDSQTGNLAYPPIPAGSYPQTTNIAWNPAGTILAALVGQNLGQYTEAESVELLQMNPGQWAAQDCDLANGNVTRDQWLQYAGPGVPLVHPCATSTRLTPASAALDLRQVDWQGITLPPKVCGNTTRPIKLNQGVATIPSPIGSGTATVSASDSPTYGTLTGTGTSAVAALNVSCNIGGTAAGQLWDGYVIYSGEDGTLHSIGFITPRAAGRNEHASYLEKIRFSHGQITTYEDFYRGTDADCCPSGRTRSVWVYRDGHLLKQASMVTAG
jgi:WD40 repeat protein